MSMLSLPEAIGRLLDSARILADTQTVPLRESLGRVLAEDVVAGIDVPPADNSAMDGYALRHRDWPGPEQPLPVSQRIVAGAVPQALAAGTAARIFTGAEIPAGADLVVMQENCRAEESSVRVLELPQVRANIRPRGQDIKSGSVVLKAGRRLKPQDLGLIASLGFAKITARRRLRAAIISTGSELVEPGEEAGPGQIYNSNRYMLAGLLEAWGFEVLDFGIAEDDRDVIADVMTRAGRDADVIITSGGVSVGEEDHVKPVVESLGRLDLWRVAIKPGKPFAFGDVAGTPFLGLPGNPVSALVTILVIARPYLFACQGIADGAITPLEQTALFDHKGSARQEYLRARMTPEGVEVYSKQSSGVLFSASWGDGMVVQAPGQDIVEGGPADFIPWSFF